MKLDCKVIKDLYVLYEAGQLSPQVKAAVEEHLLDCHECKKVYDIGEEFDILDDVSFSEAPKAVRDKLTAEFKLWRLKQIIIAVVAATLLLVVPSVYNHYSNVYAEKILKGQDYQSSLGYIESVLKFEFRNSLMVAQKSQEAYDAARLGYLSAYAIFLRSTITGFQRDHSNAFAYHAENYFLSIGTDLYKASQHNDFESQSPYIESALYYTLLVLSDINFVNQQLQGKSDYDWYKALDYSHYGLKEELEARRR